MSIVGKRVKVVMHETLNGLEGYCLAKLDNPERSIYRVALDNGEVRDLPGAVLDAMETDATEELTRPPLPPVTTEAEQQTASIMAARVYQLMEYQKQDIAEVESQIKAAQNKIAAEIRGLHSALYESQRVIAAVWAAHEARIKAGAEMLWFAKGQPVKGKTFGGAQIATGWELDTWDEDAALAYARTQAPNMISTHIDSDRFQKAVRDGLLTNVPEDVCKWVQNHSVKTLTRNLIQLAESRPQSEPNPESE